MELDIRQKETLLDAYQLTNQFISRGYLDNLPEISVDNHVYCEEQTLANVRLIQIDKIAYDKNEDIMSKLVNVYNAVYDAKGGLALLINGTECGISFHLGVRSLDNTSIVLLQKVLEKSIQGNFPGCEVRRLDRDETSSMLEYMTQSRLANSPKVISNVTGVASLKNQNGDAFVQGLEKFIDTMRGEQYTAVFLADAISKEDLAQIRKGYESIYTQMTPFATTELSFSANEATTITAGVSKGFTNTISENLTQTQSHTMGSSEGHTTGTSESHTINKGAALTGAAAMVGTVFGPVGTIIGGMTGSVAGSLLGSDTYSRSESATYGKNESNTYSDSQGQGISKAHSTQENESTADTTGESRSLQIKLENKTTMQLLAKIDQMLERVEQGENSGMWNSAAYFFAEDTQTARVASTTYAAIIRGGNTSVEGMHINLWTHEEKLNLKRVTQSLKALKHPVLNMDNRYKINIPSITPGTLVTTEELAIQMAWPRKSVQGLTVLEYAEFSRDISTYDKMNMQNRVRMGQVYHMGKEEGTDVALDVESLSMHTFITGSTGSGKSNTIYYLLNELKQKRDIPFLIIEPAKGEYKNVFGGYSDVTVLGTNPYKGELLRINPFAFPDDIHILEHIDRLTEIFNICWPMYAAMPAVLKEAIERAYINCGWNLNTSKYKTCSKVFPTFMDLLEVLPVIIQESAYSEELKGNYIGALVTRVKSLTNGLNGRIFTSDEVDESVLFDSSCIIDLSRVGSSETKALIMGILVMRLQEYRMNQGAGGNEPLKHITVLEEAHNILKRTSTEQSNESSNILGKAVELLSNSIAEMRTFGEGFIIADQSPGLLDLSVIRNTNTKIVLRLPEEGDRQLVGKAAGLNEDQIKELVKLKTGVAAVYQNNWIQPILCSIDKFNQFKAYKFDLDQVEEEVDIKEELVKRLILSRINTSTYIEGDLEELIERVAKSSLSGRLKVELLSKMYQLQDRESGDLSEVCSEKEINRFITQLVNGEAVLRTAIECGDFETWNQCVYQSIGKLEEADEYKLEVVRAILKEYATTGLEIEKFYHEWEEDQKGRVV